VALVDKEKRRIGSVEQREKKGGAGGRCRGKVYIVGPSGYQEKKIWKKRGVGEKEKAGGEPVLTKDPRVLTKKYRGLLVILMRRSGRSR